MQTEVLLLLIFFVMLPLIQQLLQTARDRNQRVPEGAKGQSARQQRPTTRQSLPDAPEASATPVPDRAAVAEVMIAPRFAGAMPPATTTRRSTRRRPTLGGVRSPVDLRRAIVHMTVLGPCRAMEAYSPRKTAGHAAPLTSLD
ncbi:MAG TPA: hypothetical protein VD837_19835 [Terriglobales bacterium]|nr:hypothetical protein [Terriglobales bacterium]